MQELMSMTDHSKKTTKVTIYKLETVSIAEPLQNRQHAQNP